MPPILAPLPRRISSKHSPFSTSDSFLIPSQPRPPRRGTLTVDIHCAKPSITVIEHTSDLLSPQSMLDMEDDEMLGRAASPLNELLGILSKPSDPVVPVTCHRPGAPAPNSYPMHYTSSTSSISTWSSASPLSISPLELIPTYPVDRERKQSLPQPRRSRGASLEPIVSPYARPGPPRRLSSMPYYAPDRRRSYTYMSTPSIAPTLEPLAESRGRSQSSCDSHGHSRGSGADLVDTLGELNIRE